ncbi:MAG: NAD(P)-dependent oxidoreductase [Phycisphaerales bacterium JB063]
MTKAVITETLDSRCADWLAERCDVVWCSHDAPGFDAHLAEASALVVRTYTIVDDALLDRAPALRVVGRAGVGLDNIDLEACRRRGVAVVYTPDANTQAVVEYVFGLVLDHYRPRPRGTMEAATTPDQFHALRKTHVGQEVADLSLGVVGLGRIGKRITTVAHAMGINTYACDVLPEPELRAAMGGVPFTYVGHDKLYAQSDIVTLHVDGRAGNRHLVDRAALAHFKDDALLINAARGMLVDHGALADWLKTHPDARAILDVHDPEPTPSDYPLHGLPNAWLLPHLASRTDTALANMSGVVRDVAAVLAGDAPKYPAV